MTTISKTLTKASVATVAAGAMALTSATPAMARDRDRGIDAGDIIAGAVILGGIAAVASAASKNRNRDGRYYNGNSRYGYNDGQRGSRRAVERCVAAAEQDARRYGYRFADVTQIRDVDDRRDGWRVKGRIVVNGTRGYNNRGYDNRYNNRNGYNRGSDSGKFTCYVSRGRVTDVDYSGIRGLR